MANETTLTMGDQIYNMYEHRLLTRALPRLLHGRWGRVAQWKGFNTYYVRRWEKLNAVTAALTEGKTPSEHVAPTITTITMTPAWYGAWVGYTDKLDKISFDPVVLETSGILGEQAGLSVDTLIRDNLVANASIDYAGGAAARNELDADNDKISFADVVYDVATLEAENAKGLEGDMYPILIHPHTRISPGVYKPSLITGNPEMATRGKQRKCAAATTEREGLERGSDSLNYREINL